MYMYRTVHICMETAYVTSCTCTCTCRRSCYNVVLTIGHSWGSGHDPETSECSPPLNINGGKYLMYAFAQDGQSRNNMVIII